MTYGLVENVAETADDPGMPQLLCDGVRINRYIAKDDRITLADANLDKRRADVRLWHFACDT